MPPVASHAPRPPRGGSMPLDAGRRRLQEMQKDLEGGSPCGGVGRVGREQRPPRANPGGRRADGPRSLPPVAKDERCTPRGKPNWSPRCPVPAQKTPRQDEQFGILVGSGDGQRWVTGSGGGGALEDAPVLLASNREDGIVYTVTAGGELKMFNVNSPQLIPQSLQLRLEVGTIAVGTSHCAILSVDGRLFEARGTAPRWSVQPMLPNRRVFAIACGDAHTAAVTLADNQDASVAEDFKGIAAGLVDPRSLMGEVVTWGVGRTGALGHGWPLRNVPDPRPVQGLTGATCTIACGMHHTLVTASGDGAGPVGLFSFGWAENGRLGESPQAQQEGHVRARPSRVKLPSSCEISLLAAGAQHSVVRLSNGEILSFGSNEFGQLGKPVGPWSQIPVKVELPGGLAHRVSHLSCGSTSTVAVTSAGEVLCWGAAAAKARSGSQAAEWAECALFAGEQTVILARLASCSAIEIRRQVWERRRKKGEAERLLAERAKAEEERKKEEEERRLRLEREAEEERLRKEEQLRAEEEARRRAEEIEAARRLAEEARKREEEERRKRREEEERQAEERRIEEEKRAEHERRVAQEALRRVEEEAAHEDVLRQAELQELMASASRTPTPPASPPPKTPPSAGTPRAASPALPPLLPKPEKPERKGSKDSVGRVPSRERAEFKGFLGNHGNGCEARARARQERRQMRDVSPADEPLSARGRSNAQQKIPRPSASKT